VLSTHNFVGSSFFTFAMKDKRKGKRRERKGKGVVKAFSDHPWCSTAPLLLDLVKQHGWMRPMDGFNGWSDCRELWIHQIEAVPINPFCAQMVNQSMMAEGKKDDGDVVEDYVFGQLLIVVSAIATNGVILDSEGTLPLPHAMSHR
jgi:hypothetical protein